MTDSIDIFLEHAYNIIRDISYCEPVNFADILFAECNWPPADSVREDFNVANLTMYLGAIINQVEKDLMAEDLDLNLLSAAICSLPQSYQDKLLLGLPDQGEGDITS